MMHVLSCEYVREQLQSFHDGELSIEEQVLVHSHLRECISCALEAADLEDLSEALREMSGALPDRINGRTDGLTAGVIERLRVEEQLSFRSRFHELFQDMHLVWPAIGATLALIVCLMGSVGVLQAASREHPDSLAGVISILANPGSNANPMRLKGYMLAPRAFSDTEIPVPTGDAVFALEAVVSREGRVQNISLLVEQQARQLKVKPEVLLAMLEAASRARFEPAQSGGSPVAVSMVWLVAGTTVTGSRNFDIYRAAPARWMPGMMGPELEPEKPRPAAAPATKAVAPATESACG